jgi:hypothetical protein
MFSFGSGVTSVGAHFVDTLWNCNMSWMIRCSEPWLMLNITATSLTLKWQFFHYSFKLHNYLQCYICMDFAQSSSICDTKHTIIKVCIPFVHLLQRYACITIQQLYMARYSNEFVSQSNKTWAIERSSFVRDSKRVAIFARYAEVLKSALLDVP